MSKQSKNAPRKAGGKQPGQPAVSPEPEALEAAPEPVTLVISQDINTMHQHTVDEKQLRLLIRDWRKGRATRTIGQVLSSAYVAIFSFVVIAAMVISSLMKAQNLAASCDAAGCTTARGLLPWAMLAGVFALTMAAARMFGPVLASAAEGFWLMEAPLRRSRLLGGRLVSAILIALFGGLLVGALVSTLTGSSVAAIIAWALAAGLGAAGLTAISAAEQGAERTWLIKAVQTLISLVGLAALLLVVATAAGWIDLGITDALTVELALIVAGVGLVMLIGAGIIARARLNNIRRARLLSGGSLVSGMQGAAFALDFGLMRDILVERQAMERGHVRPTRGVGTGLKALIMRDVQRLYRYPKPLVLLAASIIVPYAAQALGIGRLVVPVSGLVLFAALVPFFNTLRVLSRTKGLARTMPFSTSQLRTAASVVPAGLALVWAIAVTPAYLGVGGANPIGNDPAQSAMWAIITAVAGLLGAMRWVSAKSADYSSPMLSTNLGAMPPGLIFNLIRGFDMIAIISLPAILGGSPWWSVAIAAICFMFLRMGGIDQQELMAQQEEQKKQLAEMRGKPVPGAKPAAKAGQSGEKIKIKRGN